MIFILSWIIVGLIGQGVFMYLMKRKYPDEYLKDETDWDIIPFQVLMAMLAGPICFLVFPIIFSNSED
jgi:uncharacterized membrane protein